MTDEVNDMIVTLTEGHRDWYLDYYDGELNPLSDDLYYDLLMAYISGAAHGVRLVSEEIAFQKGG